MDEMMAKLNRRRSILSGAADRAESKKSRRDSMPTMPDLSHLPESAATGSDVEGGSDNDENTEKLRSPILARPLNAANSDDSDSDANESDWESDIE